MSPTPELARLLNFEKGIVQFVFPDDLHALLDRARHCPCRCMLRLSVRLSWYGCVRSRPRKRYLVLLRSASSRIQRQRSRRDNRLNYEAHEGWLQSCVNAATRSACPREADLETLSRPRRRAPHDWQRRRARITRGVRASGRPVKCYGYGVEADEPGRARPVCAGEVRTRPATPSPQIGADLTAHAAVGDLERARTRACGTGTDLALTGGAGGLPPPCSGRWMQSRASRIVKPNSIVDALPRGRPLHGSPRRAPVSAPGLAASLSGKLASPSSPLTRRTSKASPSGGAERAADLWSKLGVRRAVSIDGARTAAFGWGTAGL